MSSPAETDVMPQSNKENVSATASISGVVKPTTKVFNPSVTPFIPSLSAAPFVFSPVVTSSASSASLTVSAEPFRPSATFFAPVVPQSRPTFSTFRSVVGDLVPTADLTSNAKPNHVPARLTYSLAEMLALDTLDTYECPEGVPDFLNPETEACISFFQRDSKPKRREGVRESGREFKKEKETEAANSNRLASRNAGQGFSASGSSGSSRKKGAKGEKENSAGRSDKEMERIRLERYRQLDLELGRSTARPGHSSRPSAPVQYADIFGRAIDPLNPTPATSSMNKSYGDRGDSRDRHFTNDRGGRRGGERFGASQGNSRHGHGGPRPDDRLLSDDEVRPLENSENKWTPDSLLKSKSTKSVSRKGDKKHQKDQLDCNAKSTDGETSEADSDAEAEIARAKLIKSLTALLNKLTAENLPQIVERTVTLLSEITLVSTLKKVARLLFEKAVSSYAFAGVYAKYLNALIVHYAPVTLQQTENEHRKDGPSGGIVSSRKTIPVFFEYLDDDETSSPIRVSLVEQVLEECYGQLAMRDAAGLTNLSLSISNEDLEESFEHAATTLATRLRMRVEGTIALIGALAKEDIVPLNHVVLYISILLLNHETITLDEADCLRQILQSVGSTLDKVAKNSNSRAQFTKTLSKTTNVLGGSSANNSAPHSLASASPFAKNPARIESENSGADFSVDPFRVSRSLLYAYQRKARGKALYEFYAHVSPVITNLLDAATEQHKTPQKDDEDEGAVDSALIHNLMSLDMLSSRLSDIYHAVEEIIASVKLVSYRHACLLMDLTELRSKNWNPNAVVRRPLTLKSSGSSTVQSSAGSTLGSKNVSTSKLARSDTTKQNSGVAGHSSSDLPQNLRTMVLSDGTVGSLVSAQSTRDDDDEVDYVDDADYEKVRAGDMITPLNINLNIPSTGLIGGKTVDPGSLELIIGKIGSPAKQGKASGALAALSPNSKSRSKRQNYASTTEGQTHDENALALAVHALENEGGGEYETGETELQRAMSRTKLKRNTSSFASTSSSPGSFALNTTSSFAGEPITFERTPTNSTSSVNETNALDASEYSLDNGSIALIATHISDVDQDENDNSQLDEEEVLPEFRVKRDVYVMIDEFVDARLPEEISMCLTDLFQKAPKEFTPYAQEQWKKFQAESIAAALLGEKVMSHGVLHPLVSETFRLLVEKQQLDHFSLSRGIVLACEVVEDIKHDNPLIDRDIAAIVIKCVEDDLVDWYNVTEPLMCAANDTAFEVLDNPDYDRLSTQYLEMKSACIVFTAFLKELISRPALFEKVLSRSRQLQNNQDKSKWNDFSSESLANALCNTTLLSPIMNQVSRAFVADECVADE